VFFKNEAGKLLKTQGERKKRTGNEPENKAGHVIEKARRRKDKPED